MKKLILSFGSFAFGILLSSTSPAVESCSDVLIHAGSSRYGIVVAPLSHEDSKLESEIKKSLHRVDISDFNVGRALGDYLNDFRTGVVKNGFTWDQPELQLADSLMKLNSDSHVVDLGAGTLGPLLQLAQGNLLGGSLAMASDKEWLQRPERIRLKEHLEKFGPPNLTGITLANLRDGVPVPKVGGKAFAPAATVLQHPKMKVLAGNYFEKIPTPDLLRKFGQADLVLDYYGVLAYTLDLPVVLSKLAKMMKPGAELWLIRNDEKVLQLDGTMLYQFEYIASLPGFELVPSSGGGHAVLLRRTSANFIPPKLQLESVRDESPPRVIYREVP